MICGDGIGDGSAEVCEADHEIAELYAGTVALEIRFCLVDGFDEAFEFTLIGIDHDAACAVVQGEGRGICALVKGVLTRPCFPDGIAIAVGIAIALSRFMDNLVGVVNTRNAGNGALERCLALRLSHDGDIFGDDIFCAEVAHIGFCLREDGDEFSQFLLGRGAELCEPVLGSFHFKETVNADTDKNDTDDDQNWAHCMTPKVEENVP